jgi:hypothetical protein
MLSPSIVEQLIEDGVLTYTNPLELPAETGVCDCKECVPAYDDLEKVSDMNTFLLEQAINNRLYELEGKVEQILEALSNKPTKTKK